MRRTSTALWRRAADEVLVSTPGREEIDRLIGPAATTWELLATPRAIGELVVELAAIYQQDPVGIESDVTGLVAELLRRGAIEEVRTEA